MTRKNPKIDTRQTHVKHTSTLKTPNLKTGKTGSRALVDQRCRCADAMRMALGVPIRMVLGVVEHICAIKSAGMCWRQCGSRPHI